MGEGGLKPGANFPCCIKITFREVEDGEGWSSAWSRFLRALGSSGEAAQRKAVRNTPKAPKSHGTAPLVSCHPRGGCREVALLCPRCTVTAGFSKCPGAPSRTCQVILLLLRLQQPSCVRLLPPNPIFPPPPRRRRSCGALRWLRPSSSLRFAAQTRTFWSGADPDPSPTSCPRGSAGLEPPPASSEAPAGTMLHPAAAPTPAPQPQPLHAVSLARTGIYSPGDLSGGSTRF